MLLYCSFLLYDFLKKFILYQTLGPKLIARFVGMHVGMDWRTIMETQTTIIVLFNFQLGNYTHDSKQWK